MGFLSLWPLAFLLLVPVIILLYILKQEAKPFDWSSNMLWQEVYRNMEATKPWEKLRKNLLMFLQILTVVLFVLVLMNPWIRSRGEKPDAVVMVLDSSASMDEIYDGDETRLSCAKKLAKDYIDSYASGTPVYLVNCNEQAVLVLSGSTDKLDLKAKIDGIAQTNLPGTAANALGLVQSCVNLSEDSKVVFFTDTTFDIGDLNATVVSVYSEQDNAAVDTVSADVSEDGATVLVSITGYSGNEDDAEDGNGSIGDNGSADGSSAAGGNGSEGGSSSAGENESSADGGSDGALFSGEVNLYAVAEDGTETLLDIGSYAVKGGATQAVYFTVPAGKLEGATAFCARLNDKDALSGDNEAYTVLDEYKDRKVLLMTKSNLFVEKAFGVLSHMELYRTSETALPSDADYDLYIFDGMVPDTLPESGSFLFINCDRAEIFENCGKVSGTKLTVVDNPLMTELSGDKIGVNESLKFTMPSWADVWLRTSDGDCAGFYGVYEGHRIMTMGFDVHATDYVLQAEFPILISDMADYLLDGGLAEKTQTTVGSSVELYGSSTGGDFQIISPDRTESVLSAEDSSGAYLDVNQIGVYTLSQTVGSEEKMQKLASNFPTSEESSVEAASDMTQAVEAEDSVGGVQELRNILLVILMILLVAEWVIYVRMT